MTRLTRAESRTRTRSLLLDASERVFARRGYRGASLDEIAAEAGFSKGAVYSNFASKEDLFLALLDRHLDASGAAARSAATAVRPPGPHDGPGPGTGAPAAAGPAAAGGSAPDPVSALAELATPADPAAWEWGLLTMEFFLYAAREPAVKDRLAAILEGQRTHLASMLEAAWPQLTSGALGPRDVASVIMALSTGLGVQVVLDPGSIDPSLFPRVLEALVGPPAPPGPGRSTAAPETADPDLSAVAAAAGAMVAPPSLPGPGPERDPA